MINKSNRIKEKYKIIEIFNDAKSYWKKQKVSENITQPSYIYNLKEPLVIWKNSIFTLKVYLL